MKETIHKTGILVRKGLDIRAVCLVVDGVHLGSRDSRIAGGEIQIIGELMTVIIDRLSAFFEFFPFTHGNLPAEGEVINTKILEDAALDIGIEGFYRESNFGMAGKYLVKGLSLLKKRGNGPCNQDALRFGKTDTLPGIREVEKVSLVSLVCIIEIMVKTAVADLITMITGANRAVPQRAGLFKIIRTAFGTGFAGEGTVLKVGTDNRRIKAVARFESSVFFNLLGNGCRVFGNRTGDTGF